MKTIIEVEWSDEDRARLVEFLRRWRRVSRLPALARREDVRAFVTEAMANQWLYIEDMMSYLDEMERATPPAGYTPPPPHPGHRTPGRRS